MNCDNIVSDDNRNVSVDILEAEEVPLEEAEEEEKLLRAQEKVALKPRNRAAHNDILSEYVWNDEAKKLPFSSPS